jgi:cyclase
VAEGLSAVTRPFEHGLHEIADGVHAYIQPDGSWGWNNAGVVVGHGASTLVDTLFDLRLTASMLDSMSPFISGSPIRTLVNTHANGDHCFGNQLVTASGTVDVVTSAATADELEIGPKRLFGMLAGQHSANLGAFLDRAFGPFDFSGIEVPPVTTTFSGTMTLDTGDRRIELIEVGPAHTGGDIIAWLPSDRVLFAGDILFIGGTPVMWAGPIANWVNACELIVSLNPAVIVPGHGPLTDLAGVEDVASYLRTVNDLVTERHASGMSVDDTVRDVDVVVNGTRFGTWTDRERLIPTVHTLWRELEPAYMMPDWVTIFGAMAEYFARRQ